METSQLRRLRFIEGLIMNIPYMLFLLLFFVMPIYLGMSSRLTASFLLITVLCLDVFSRRLSNLFYTRILPFMKPLWDYDQQKLFSAKWIKWRRNRRVFNTLMVIGIVFIIIFAPPMPEKINWLASRYSIIGGLIGFNIGMAWNVFTEEFNY